MNVGVTSAEVTSNLKKEENRSGSSLTTAERSTTGLDSINK